MDQQINTALLELAQRRSWQDAGGMPMEKIAVVPADPAMMAAGGGGAPPMDPAMAGGAGAIPPVDPAVASAGGGAPMPMDPAMAAAGGAPMDPAAAAGGAPATAPKMKPEQMMQMLDFRLYNLQQQLTAIMNAMGIELDPGALITPPGSPTPVAEAAVPGGPQDPGAKMQPGGAEGGDPSAIQPIQPIQGAHPDGGAEKAGEATEPETVSDALEKMSQADPATFASAIARSPITDEVTNFFSGRNTSDNAAAVAAMLRKATNAN